MALQFRRLLTTLTLLASVGCCYWSFRLGWADLLARETSPEVVKKSLELAPGNSKYLQYAANAVEDDGGDGMALRLRAAKLNPLDSWNWIQLATEAEAQNKLGEAERYLLRAYDVDCQFQPRWALANFYLRRGDGDRALEWARKTLEFGGGDLTAVFQLCWNASSNGSEILEKSIPRRPEVMGQYLQYLDGTARLDEANEVAKRLLPIAGTDQAPVLAAHCTLLLSSGKAIEPAISVWNALIERGWLQNERVEPEAGKSLVNPNFARALTGIGFNWAIPSVEGVAVEQLDKSPGIRVVFSRKEPENCVILGEYLALVPERKYRFRFRYETTAMSGAGIKWLIYNPSTNAVLLSASTGGRNSADLSAGEHTAEFDFQTPPASKVLPNCGNLRTADSDRLRARAAQQRFPIRDRKEAVYANFCNQVLARIELRYEREAGTVRPEGSIRFSHLQLGFAQ